MTYFAEYIWLDGAVPSQTLRSKARVIPDLENPELKDFPEWGYDGSSTNQAEGSSSDLVLRPVNFVPDPIKGPGNFLVLCEVFSPNGKPHPTNHRAILRHILDKGGAAHEPTLGFEQEYTLFQGRVPLGWPENGFPQAQGPFYCGVGSDRAYGRELVELHADMCLEAGLLLYGINAEVMPGQWEFQIGYRGIDGDDISALNICDHLWLACWLLHRLGEDFEVWANFDNKPIKGDWNGAGCHTNFSTKDMRDPKKGRATIDKAIKLLSKKHMEHVELYGHDLDTRLTGLHETCDINTFKSGVSDRGSSIRIPLGVEQNGYGYLEDRRPGANSDPYLVAARLIATICEVDDAIFKKVVYRHPVAPKVKM